MSSKTLAAYFSASGNTASVAKEVAAQAGTDLCEIKPAQPYTSADLDWNNKKSRSPVEMNDPASRPAIADKVADMDSCDTVLESHDFAGRKIALFATSGGNGLGSRRDAAAWIKSLGL